MGQFTDQIKASLENLTKLKIETEVVSTGETQGLKTEIDLLQGDIKNTFHAKYAGDPEELRKFHEAQVARGQEIIDKNIASLKALFEFVVENQLDQG